jgi:hypothetical protein
VKKSAIPLFASTHMDHWVAAENYKGDSPQIFWAERDRYRQAYGEAVARGDIEYLQKCVLARQYLLDEAAGKNSKSDYLTPERFIIEGYRWLRLHDGQGSPRPRREEIRVEAKRIWAYQHYRSIHPKEQITYRAFLHRAESDWQFNEMLNVMSANAENIFPVHSHLDIT